MAANVTNNGTVRPDSVPGGLTIQGTFSQTAAGRLELTLRGRDATLAHRSLRITGAATFAGALDVALGSPFDEPQNSTFAIASYASSTGDFATITGLTGNFGYDFIRAFGATSLDLTVTTKAMSPPLHRWRSRQSVSPTGSNPSAADAPRNSDRTTILIAMGW